LSVGQPERVTQERVIALFRDELGYEYLDDWSDRPDNSNIEEEFLAANLIERGYTPAQIGDALHRLRAEANNPNRSLYENNKASNRSSRSFASISTVTTVVLFSLSSS